MESWERTVEELTELAELAWENYQAELETFGYAAPWFTGWSIEAYCDGFVDERRMDDESWYEAMLDAQDDMYEQGWKFFLLEESL